MALKIPWTQKNSVEVIYECECDIYIYKICIGECGDIYNIYRRDRKIIRTESRGTCQVDREGGWGRGTQNLPSVNTRRKQNM